MDLDQYRVRENIETPMSSAEKTQAFSAPGKALLAGGYLVLDPSYRSYVVALSARMHAMVKTSDLEQNAHFELKISSSQFNNDSWTYTLDAKNRYSVLERDGKKNPFIEMVLFNLFNYFKPQQGKKILIETFSDDGYHSQLNSVPKRNAYKGFSYHANSITEVPKTGLGSSAGLVTVLTTALVSVFKPNLDVQNCKDLQLIHGLAQVAHCQAQGKIGSGFDVAAATFGSIVYRRFAPELISDLPEHSDVNYSDELRSLIDDRDWKISNTRVRLPDGLRLVMGDVNSGSETTKLVSKVKAWYSSNPLKGLEIYQRINNNNEKVMAALTELDVLSRKNPTSYSKLLKALDAQDGALINQFTELLKIRHAVEEIRDNFRQVTKESGADIEPAIQTALLDNCSKLKGVLTGVVPGAGGYDAIVLIATEKSNLQLQTKNKKEFAAVTWLDLHQEDVGVKQENPVHYQNLVQL
ncbi:hypothetical protein ZYGR_0AF01700 [Zygosaccharomyces rouxii]|uniref:Phosphomevalonate kinase n=1 Tax=Zygosaccharomyces rouxii TaxID=4956 RepID=A0A1Q3A7J6_ZYGRO|nr:hypothetical protein ZYGR_0AF01700 [Zygosaccharomyces rouxii]